MLSTSQGLGGMRILLVDIIDNREYIQTVFPGLGLAYLAAYLHQELPGHEIRIVQRDIFAALATFQPEIVGISSVTQNWPAAERFAAQAKRTGAAVIVGGVHITVLPTELAPGMDVGVLGEGEATLVALVRAFDPQSRTFRGLADIPGIVYRGSDTLRTTAPALNIHPLDAIPFPARHLLELPRHGVVHMFSSRGCRYRCSFCFSSRFWGKPRHFSPRYVLEELESVVRAYSPARIYFHDDLFIEPRARFREIVNGIVARGLNRRLDFNLNCRANLIDEETADLMKQMRVVTANFGFESGCDEVLRYLKGSSVTVADNRKAAQILKRRGIKVLGTFIIGSPRETREQILQTYEFIRAERLDFAETYLLTPLPGTPVWQYALDRGLVSVPMDWALLDQEPERNRDRRVILSETLTREELYRLHDRFQTRERRARLRSWARSAATRPWQIPRFILRQSSMRLHRLRQNSAHKSSPHKKSGQV